MRDHQTTAGSAAAAPADRRPAWLDNRRYPFESNYLATDAGRVHYVDEGEGETLLMLHGNPTWSFLNRHLIRGLSDEYRCVAPDYLGFGLSEKPRHWSYRPRAHTRVIDELIESLELTDVTLCLQDWGGPIGVDYATRRPDNVSGFVVMNTAAWPLADNWRVQAFSRVAGSRVGQGLDRRYNAAVDWVMPRAFGDRSQLTPAIHDHYRAPFADPADRRGASIFARELLGSTDWLSALWERRRLIADKPAIICWGMQGPLFGRSALGRWQALFPTARTAEFDDAGHFVQEEAGVEMVPEIERFMVSELG